MNEPRDVLDELRESNKEIYNMILLTWGIEESKFIGIERKIVVSGAKGKE